MGSLPPGPGRTAVGETDPSGFFKVGGGMVNRQLKKEFHGDNERLKRALEKS